MSPRSAAFKGDKLKALAHVAKRFEGWSPASEILTAVQSLPTIFPQIDVALQCKGWPLQRVALIHGPSNHGKTLLCHGLGLSFLKADSFYQLIDAEFTTDRVWLAKLFGAYLEHPGCIALRPKSYEETVDSVRASLVSLKEARERGDIPDTTSSVTVVDSIKKLVPERMIEAIKKEKGGIDGMSGRAAMYKAALHAQWLDELIPLLYHTNSTLVIIGRESQKVDAKPYEKQWELTGGKALFFDSSVVARVERANFITQGEGENRKTYGERHRVVVHKTKVGGKEGKEITAYFHSSNGTGAPYGFDRARDVLELAIDHDVLKKTGTRIHDCDGVVLGNGQHEASRYLRANPDRLDEIEVEAREAAEQALKDGQSKMSADVEDEEPEAPPRRTLPTSIVQPAEAVRKKGGKRPVSL